MKKLGSSYLEKCYQADISRKKSLAAPGFVEDATIVIVSATRMFISSYLNFNQFLKLSQHLIQAIPGKLIEPLLQHLHNKWAA